MADARMEKVREALEENIRTLGALYDAALAEVEEWETRLAQAEAGCVAALGEQT